MLPRRGKKEAAVGLRIAHGRTARASGASSTTGDRFSALPWRPKLLSHVTDTVPEYLG